MIDKRCVDKSIWDTFTVSNATLSLPELNLSWFHNTSVSLFVINYEAVTNKQVRNSGSGNFEIEGKGSN